MLKQGVAVNNAGIVLLNSYIPMLLERLDLIENKVFNSEEKQEEAIHYLQYTVVGLSQREESSFILNKILCGLAIETPTKKDAEISSNDEMIINSLIKSAIGYWSAIGESSVNGFRGNWLLRNGVLREEVERWTLTVEKKAYDTLLLSSPFSFSIIKFPWMEKPLHVTWSF